MADEQDREPARKGKLSAFALLKSWLFSKNSPEPARAETEFLNTKDGYELARFAKEAFGGDADSKRAHEEAVAAEQAEIDALLQGTGSRPVPTPAQLAAAGADLAPAAAAAPSPAPAPAPAAPTRPPVAAPAAPVAVAPAGKPSVDVAVKHLETLRGQGFSVEMLAEALIIIESREVKQRAANAA